MPSVVISRLAQPAQPNHAVSRLALYCQACILFHACEAPPRLIFPRHACRALSNRAIRFRSPPAKPRDVYSSRACIASPGPVRPLRAKQSLACRSLPCHYNSRLALPAVPRAMLPCDGMPCQPFRAIPAIPIRGMPRLPCAEAPSLSDPIRAMPAPPITALPNAFASSRACHLSRRQGICRRSPANALSDGSPCSLRAAPRTA